MVMLCYYVCVLDRVAFRKNKMTITADVYIYYALNDDINVVMETSAGQGISRRESMS